MCGIAGVVHTNGQRADAKVLQAMIRAIRHRGPDESGVHIDREVGLAHARLSILDPVGGRQPMTLPDGRVCVTYNGEIFNYVELREEMERGGVQFTTTSDTEVLLHRFAQRGPACVHDFNGQWAYAAWDAQERRLTLSRDRIGILPLFYTFVDGALVFASEIKAILAHPGVSRALDLRALDQIFTFWHPIGGRTAFEGIRLLPPGCNLTYQDGRTRVDRYWSFTYEPGAVEGTPDELAGRLRELLVDATRLRLRADVPVGSYLSGGLDSTTVAALATRYTTNKLQTFSVTFGDPEFDESSFQQAAIRHLATRHREAACRGPRVAEVFPHVIWHTESPIIRTAPAPLYVLSGLVREGGYKVVLTGEGADEVFGGYDIFKEAKIRRFWASAPDSESRPLLLRKLYPYMGNMQRLPTSYRKRFFRVEPEALGSPFFSHLPRWDLTSGLKALFSDVVREAVAGYDAREELRDSLPEQFETWPAFCQAQYLESTGVLPGYILASQGDRMLMAHSVEGRFPFLDHRVIAFGAGLPLRMKMAGLNEKHLLKRAAAGLVPPEIRSRPKQPYRAPDAVSFDGLLARPAEPNYVHQALSEDAIAKSGMFRTAAVGSLVQKARTGGLTGVRDNMAFVAVLSTQLVSQLFVEQAR